MALPISDTYNDVNDISSYSNLRHDMSKVIIKGMKKHKITGMSIALMDEGKIVWAQGFGYADKENKRPADANTLYKAGSISKVFTATAIMQLMEQGKVDLDVPIQTYIPELKPKYHFEVNTPITLRLIMQHRSGLTGDKMAGMFSESPKRFDTIIDYLNNVYHPYAPDTVSAYSNLATDLQGIVIERVSGMRFEDYLDKNILKPLGMQTSTFDEAKVDPSLYSRAYMKNREGIEYPLRDIPAGNLFTSAIELSHFTRLVLNDGVGIISKDNLDKMLQAPDNHETVHDMEMSMALNWAIKRPKLGYLGQIAWHNGGTIHFMSAMVILPEQGLSVVVLSNSATSLGFVEELSDRILMDAAQIKSGINKPEDPPFPGKAANMPPELLNSLPGYYATLLGGMDIKANGNKLVASMPGLSFDMQYLDSDWIKLKPRLWGFIPLPSKFIQTIYIRFEENHGRKEIIASVERMKFPAGIRVAPYEIDEHWRNYLNRYQAITPDGEHIWFKGVSLSEKNGYLILDIKMSPRGGGRLVLRPVGKNMAIIEGTGRGMNETIYFERHNGEFVLRYSGYEMIKK